MLDLKRHLHLFKLVFLFTVLLTLFLSKDVNINIHLFLFSSRLFAWHIARHLPLHRAELLNALIVIKEQLLLIHWDLALIVNLNTESLSDTLGDLTGPGFH